MLPLEFVYIDQVHPDIRFDIRYFSKLNFTGEIIDGYCVNRSIMTKAAANAIAKVQEIVAKNGLDLVIYDSYRPIKAVEHFFRWSQSASDDSNVKENFYPHIQKSNAFELGYIGRQSSHSRGSTIDLSLIEKSSALKAHKDITPSKRLLPDGRIIHFLDDGTLDMGSHFDLFDKASWHQDSIFSGEYLERRTFLRKIMMENGFDDYRKEWWHYCLIDEPFPDKRFDFDVI